MRIRVTHDVTPEKAALAIVRHFEDSGLKDTEIPTAIHRSSRRKLAIIVKSVVGEYGNAITGHQVSPELRQMAEQHWNCVMDKPVGVMTEPTDGVMG